MQRALDVGQGDVHDRDVEQQHEGRRADGDQGPPFAVDLRHGWRLPLRSENFERTTYRIVILGKVGGDKCRWEDPPPGYAGEAARYGRLGRPSSVGGGDRGAGPPLPPGVRRIGLPAPVAGAASVPVDHVNEGFP